MVFRVASHSSLSTRSQSLTRKLTAGPPKAGSFRFVSGKASSPDRMPSNGVITRRTSTRLCVQITEGRRGTTRNQKEKKRKGKKEKSQYFQFLAIERHTHTHTNTDIREERRILSNRKRAENRTNAPTRSSLLPLRLVKPCLTVPLPRACTGNFLKQRNERGYRGA